MPTTSCRPETAREAVRSDDVIVGLDLASGEHQVTVLDPAGKRLMRFRVPHSRAGIAELLRRTTPAALGVPARGRRFAFEATGHTWEAVANWLTVAGERYVVVNPLATFRVREARSMDRTKTDRTDADEIAELARTGLATRTQLEPAPYLALRRLWGEYVRLREARANLKTTLALQLHGLFPEFLGTWADLFSAGALAVLRTGLTPAVIAQLSFQEFAGRVRLHQQGRRLWLPKLRQLHAKAQQTVACPRGMDALAREARRLVARVDLLTAQMRELQREIEAQLAELPEAAHLATIPGLAWASVAGILAHVGHIGKYRHGRQLIKLAGTNPSRRNSGQAVGPRTPMTHRGRAGLRAVLYQATIACLAHNPRVRAHYDRLIGRTERPLAKMVAVGACMNKLLLYAFAVMKRQQAFEVDHRWSPNPNTPTALAA